MNNRLNPQYSLPADKNNDYNLGEFGLPCMLTNADKGVKMISLSPDLKKPNSWARFVTLLRQTVAKDRRVFFIDGVPHTASINWLRDHVHEMKAYKHWEYDIKSYLDFMIENQHPDGYFYEIACVHDNVHTKIVPDNCVKQFPDDGIALVKIELEADIEYLVVEGAVTVFKATGDEDWLKKVLPALEKGIDYMTSDPKRWDEAHGLVKRPFTMDTWDFVYGCKGDDRRIYPTTPMSIMHGDNTGVYAAMIQLAWINRRFGNEEKAASWEKRAAELKANLDKYCWNGKHYIHQLHLNHDGAEDADETNILSLSNTYDMNRGATTPEQTESIINEYINRGKTGDTFAEFYCIHPPYTKFKNADGGYWNVNEYVNGGLSTFTAGELCKAAFQNGFEEYGWDILNRVRNMVMEDGNVHFLYHPETGKDMSGGPSGWGSAALLDAIDAGLAGIVDKDCCFRELDFSPRFAATEIEEIRYVTGYETSKRLVQTDYKISPEGMAYQLLCPSQRVNCHILLPKGKTCKEVYLNGEKIDFEISRVRNSDYVDFSFTKAPTEENKWEKLERQSIEIIF